jgi:uncharacterized protein (DUF1501 family)
MGVNAMFTRRDFLRQSALISLAPVLPGFVARTAEAARAGRDDRVLVVVQLDGGNDGINTVVPFGDEEYGRHRKVLKIASNDVCKLNDQVGLNRAMKRAADMVQDGRLAIVQGVGYPNPNRSHFESMAIWHTAHLDPEEGGGNGWLGNALDSKPSAGGGPGAVFIGDRDQPRALVGRRAVVATFADALDLATSLPAPPSAGASGDDLSAFVRRTVTGAYATAAELEAAAKRGADSGTNYPATDLGKRLELVSRSLKGGSAARVYYVIQPGYDTHALQMPTQTRLLGELAGALRAFMDDLAAAKLADRVVVLAFSEFGRRPAENGSLGTDHGTAGPVFIAGPSVQAGLIGQTPRLGELEDNDLKWSIDFRRVYATVLDRWLGVSSEATLGERFEPLPLLKG